ncbi:MAG: hypothetical protein LBK94_09345, partial [Prevotellaceae bacterium]|nr:hypothetical protein [Prevotellaceae bacterium]
GHQKFFESPETQRAITYLSLIAPVAKGVSVIGNIIRTGAKFLAKQAVKSGGKYSDDLVKAAQKLYPKKAGKIEMHHITPKYLGGTKNGPLVPLDGAYHQQITNAFRHVWSYGKAPINEIQRKQIMEQVYKQFPLPFGYPF